MSNAFQTLGLCEPLLRALAAENYTTPTAIQTQAIPLILKGRDVLGLAQTGTGKTAAFGLPLLQRLAESPVKAGPQAVRALILAPTRELAVQIHESLQSYGRNLRLRHAVILGGVSQHKQVVALRQGVDVLVATPGRLIDLINQRVVNLGATSTLIIDEADRMFDMGFIKDVKRISALLPRERHSMLFSATMPPEVSHFVAELLHQPARIEVAPETMTADRVEQKVYFVEPGGKRAILRDLLQKPEMNRVIVFTRTKHGANKLAETLQKSGDKVEAIHGNKSQNARQRALEQFREGKVRILVATDIAARGIDIDDVSHVINYELPDAPESYVHRIGRTARAGNGGIAIALCEPDERFKLSDIEKLIKQELASANGPRPALQKQGKKTVDYANPRNKRGKFRARRDTRRAA